MNTKKKTLYLGTSLEEDSNLDHIIHYPIIQLAPLPIPLKVWEEFQLFTHILFTSKNAVSIFFESIEQDVSIHWLFKNKKVIAIGDATARRLTQYNLNVDEMPKNAQQEGLIQLFETQDLKNAYFFYPRSSLARKNLEIFFIQKSIRYCLCDLYQTQPQTFLPKPNWNEIQEIVFTSPSTVQAFIQLFHTIPCDKKLTCIGPVTKQALDESLEIQKHHSIER